MSPNYVKGFDKVRKQLSNLQNRMIELRGRHEVPLTELLNPEFMKKHTKYKTLKEMADKNGLTINNAEDIEKLKKFIVNNSTFKSWEELLKAANAIWVQKKLGLT